MRNIAIYFILMTGTLCAQTSSIQGPDAPFMSVVHDPVNGFEFTLHNPINSNNYNGMYSEFFSPPTQIPDSLIEFQGYVIYQFKSLNDADDSVHIVALDTTRSLPIVIVDKMDGINQGATSIDPYGPDSCSVQLLSLDDSGFSSSYFGNIDPFTGLPHLADSTYCFVTLAFGYNEYRQHPSCGTLDQLIFSKSSPGGQIIAQCANAISLGFHEQSISTEMVIGSNVGSGPFIIRVIGADQVEVIDLLGRNVHTEPVTLTTESIFLQLPDHLSSGQYHVLLLNENRRIAQGRIELIR